jgi:hypothetical protein
MTLEDGMKVRLPGTGTPNSESPSPITADASAANAAPRLLPMIDEALGSFTGRNLVTAVEVVDLLLDLRSEVELERSLFELVRSGQS